MRLSLAVIAGVAALTASAVALADPAPSRDCFASTGWQGWSASEDGNTLYLQVRQDDIYRVGLSEGSRVRDRGGRFLVNRVRGSGWICSAIDLDLTLSDQNGLQRSLIATSLHKLSAEEVAALPAEDRPS